MDRKRLAKGASVSEKPLTPRQKAFAEYYAACGNATESARKAGYKHPDPQGSQNLGNPRIAEYIRSLSAKPTEKRILTAQERQAWWTSVVLGEEPDADMKDRLKASELLGRSQADFIDKHEVTGKDGEALVINIMRYSDGGN